jgi:hypothetical protein
VEISRDTLERLEVLTTDCWLLCNEIATARQVGPRNDTLLRVPTDDDYWGWRLETGVIGSAVRPPRPPLFPFSVTLVSFEFSGTSRIEFLCS